MVDFKELRKNRRTAAPVDPFSIFKRLPKPPHMNDMWDGQSKALESWMKRRAENDLVIKLNTGGGKTLVGLLIGQSLLNELHSPVLYLCPTNQLVEQTAEKAAEISLPCVAYSGDFDEFLNAKAICIASYKALFNGLSRFGVLGSGREPVKVGGIICDDAHSALGTIRDSFTISITKDSQPELYANIAGRFRADVEAIGRAGTFDDIVERGEAGVIEIPYPAWFAKAGEVRQFIARDYGEVFKFELPLLRDYFNLCHAFVNAREIAITAIQPFVHLFPSFAECQHRVFMSATIADDSAIVRTFDADAKAIANPIVPESLAGVGERMILAPSLMNLKDEPLDVAKAVATEVSKTAGTVILVQSEWQANKSWGDVSIVAVGDDVGKAVKNLISGTSKGPYAFPNRYDGLDLVGDACRLLILQGLPRATNTYELFRAETLRGNSSTNVGLAQRFEQGIGRGTRGSGDYCVVLLVGKDLTSWISRSESLALLTPSTRTQVKLGYDISKSIKGTNELFDSIYQCLRRNKEWVKYHAETLADRAEHPEPDKRAIAIASAERDCIRRCMARDFEGAVGILRGAADAGGVTDRYIRGWLLQLAARTAMVGKNDALARELQQTAFASNAMLMPPIERPRYEPLTDVGDQVGGILSEITKFALRKGALDEFERTVALLTPAATANQFEEALKRFGELLGFRGQRPEHDFRIGPDVLWLNEPAAGFVIECKSRKDPKNALTKDEHGQLLTSLKWAHDQYPKRELTGFVVHPSEEATEPAAATGTHALTMAVLGELVGTSRQFYQELCASLANGEALEKICAQLIEKFGIAPKRIVEKLKRFRVAAAPKKK